MWIPGITGLILLGVFLWHERRTDHPMLPLSLFRSRNFAVGNAATLLIYGGLGAATFFVTIFLQQVSRYSPIAAGLSLVPLTLIMWSLSRRFGALSRPHRAAPADGLRADRRGARAHLDGAADANVDYWTELLPGVLVFGLGLSATVAPLTNTVLGVGAAQRWRRQRDQQPVARVGALLAIAAVGAVVAGSSRPPRPSAGAAPAACATGR